MSGCTRVLQCTIRSQDGGEVQRTVEIKGEGKSYLRCLSEGLSAMQSDVNTLLTEMVDKEKSQAAKSGARAESDEGMDDDDDDDDNSDADSNITPRPKRSKV